MEADTVTVFDDQKPEAVPCGFVQPIVAFWWTHRCGWGQRTDKGATHGSRRSPGVHFRAPFADLPFGAIGGAILGFRVGLADPELVYWTHSGQLVFMAVLGGFSNFFGPIIGALTYTLLQDQLQSLTEYWRSMLGIILALIVIGLPEGVSGLAVDLRRRLTRRTA